MLHRGVTIIFFTWIVSENCPGKYVDFRIPLTTKTEARLGKPPFANISLDATSTTKLSERLYIEGMK